VNFHVVDGWLSRTSFQTTQQQQKTTLYVPHGGYYGLQKFAEQRLAPTKELQEPIRGTLPLQTRWRLPLFCLGFLDKAHQRLFVMRSKEQFKSVDGWSFLQQESFVVMILLRSTRKKNALSCVSDHRGHDSVENAWNDVLGNVCQFIVGYRFLVVKNAVFAPRETRLELLKITFEVFEIQPRIQIFLWIFWIHRDHYELHTSTRNERHDDDDDDDDDEVACMTKRVRPLVAYNTSSQYCNPGASPLLIIQTDGFFDSSQQNDDDDDIFEVVLPISVFVAQPHLLVAALFVLP
jgi:hypothetical protein